jgi:MoxR-like ATPase
VARRTTTTLHDTVEAVMTAAEILELQRIVREVPAADHVIRYALAVVRQTRVREPGVPDFIKDQIGWGAGPRAVQFLILGGKARALLQGRTHVTCDDIQALAKPVLRHRLVLTFTAESEGVSPDQIVDRILTITPTREDELTGDARFQKIFAS